VSDVLKLDCYGCEQELRKVKLEFLPVGSDACKMNEEEIENRFREIRNELKACNEQIATLKEDLKILLKHRSIACRDIVDTSRQLGNRAFDQSDVQKCREFLQKYNIRL
jgi:hypothetical protein